MSQDHPHHANPSAAAHALSHDGLAARLPRWVIWTARLVAVTLVVLPLALARLTEQRELARETITPAKSNPAVATPATPTHPALEPRPVHTWPVTDDHLPPSLAQQMREHDIPADTP